MNFTVPFSQLNKTNIPTAGGKGANLGEMTAAGFPVPRGFVLMTAAYDAFVKAHGLQQKIVDLAHTVSADDPQSSEVASEKIKQLFLGAEMPIDIADEVMAANEVLGETAVAVRSSATAEDLIDASFAGQQETYLNIQGKEALLDAVKKCWASLWTARAITYRLKQNIAPADVSLAVIVQKQIASDVSGIAFSLNPNNNAYDEAVINASFGLGETIVSGQVTPDTYVVEKVTSEILEKKVAEKGVALWPLADGGTEQKENETPNAQALTNAQILDVTKLTTACEAHYGRPMDIEWAIADDTLYLLQARPITTYLPLFAEMVTNSGEQKYLYLDILGMTQGFTDSISVLGLEMWKLIMQNAIGWEMPDGMDGIVLFYHGRTYYHVSNLLRGMGKMGDMVLANYDGSVKRTFDTISMADYLPKEKPARVSKARWGLIKSVFSMVPMAIRATLFDYKKVENEYLAVTTKIKSTFKEDPDPSLPFRELVDGFMDEYREAVKHVGAQYAGINAERPLKKMFKGQGMDHYIMALGAKNNPTSLMGVHMAKVANYDEFQATQTADEFVARLQNGDYSQPFLDDYEQYMRDYGARGYREIDIATPRSYEDLITFFLRLKDINLADSKLATTEERRDEAYNKLLSVAQQGGFEKKFRKQADIYETLFGYREDTKYIIVLGIAKLRKAALTKGELLVSQGRLAHPNDIFDLTIAQIQRAETDDSFDLRATRDLNLKPYKMTAHVKQWPLVIDSRGKIFRATKRSEDGDLIGDPIAPGVIKGRAKVLLSPHEKPLEPGEILVTMATEPSWTPIFGNAAGVVMEVGGSLHHGAIIAREYGLPCVSGLTGATTLIKDGDLIEVDGNNGIVRIYDNKE